jgi:hypothetical protein
MKRAIFSTDFSKNTQISNSVKIRPVGVELFHADRWTDTHDEANGRISQFWKHARLESTEFIKDTCRDSGLSDTNTQNKLSISITRTTRIPRKH